MNYFELTKKEHEVIEVFWQRDGEFTASDLIALSPKRTWSTKSIHVILNSMVEKGAMKVVSEIKIARTKAKVYRAALSQEDYALMQYKHYFGGQAGKASSANLVCAIYEKEKDKDRLIDELEKFLSDEKKKRGLA